MPAFTLHLTVATATAHVRVAVRLAEPLPWQQVRPAVCRAAALAPETDLYIGVGLIEPDWLVGCPPLLHGRLLTTRPLNEVPVRAPLTVEVIAGQDAGRAADLGATDLTVGREPDSGLPLSDPAVSRSHALLRSVTTGVAVTDLGATNGVVVDGATVTQDPLIAHTGSVLRVGSSLLQIQLATEPGGSFRPDGTGHSRRTGRPPAVPPRTAPLPEQPDEPEPPTRRSLPLVSALIGALVGTVLAVVTHNAMFLAFAAFGPVMMIGSAVSDRVQGRRSYRRQCRDHRRDMAAWQLAVRDFTLAERSAAWRRWPGPAQLLRRAESASDRLWDRHRDDSDFLAVCVGFGSRDMRESVTVSDVPVTAQLGGVFGFVGSEGRAAARFVVLQIVCLYSPADISVHYVGNGADFAACADVPHAHTGRAAHHVVILDGAAALASPWGVAAIAATDPDTTVLVLVDSSTSLPTQAVSMTVHDATSVRTCVGPELLARALRAVAPLQEATDGDLGEDIPSQLSLADVVGPVSESSLRARWATPSPRAVLGRGATGPVEWDMHADGPHLLIAGTTGSGKSELLQTLIASLALNSPPEVLTLLLVDYKGGSAFGAVADLPHVVGMLTDLDPDTSARALASLRAELRRRERLAAAGRSTARLVLVIDEFATLAAELPEFLTGLLDIAQRGRSLGLHLVLATQRPAGVVSPAMRANISTRICLRVTDPAESMDVIGTADAARLPPDRPGMALLRRGSTTVRFQTALSTAPAPPPVQAWPVDASPERKPLSDGRKPLIDEVIAAARQESRHSPQPPRPWLPPLPETIDPTPEEPYAFALVDYPNEQRQDWSIAPQSSLLVIGPAGSGRSMALRRFGEIAALRGEELLVIDGGSDLADLAEWPSVSSYLPISEPRLVLRLLTLLADAARRPTDARRRRLIVDHFDLVVAELERTDYASGAGALTDIEVRSAGTVAVVAAGPTRLEHHRAAQRFTEIVDLGTPVTSTPGRAHWRGHTAQIVRAGPPPAPRPRPWADAIVVRPLPEIATSPLTAACTGRVPLGIGGDDAKQVDIDVATSSGALAVVGPRSSGVSTVLESLGGRAAASGIRVVKLWIGALAESPNANIGQLDCRNDAAPLLALLAAHDGPLMLLAEVGAQVDDHPVAAVLGRFLQVCTAGQHLVLAATSDAWSRARRGLLPAALSRRRGVLLHPDPISGALFDLNVPHRRGPLPPGRGLWIDGAAAIPIQIAQPPAP